MELKSHIQRIKRPRLDLPQTSYGAGALAARYGFPLVKPGPRQSVAFISLGGGTSTADNQAYCAHYGIPVPSFTFVSVDGATNQYTGDPNSADGENALDCQNIIGATRGLVDVICYGAPNSDTGFAHAIAQVAADNKACACSISWGQDEAGWSKPSMTAMDAAIQACLSQSIPVFVASGDDGSADGGTGNNVDYPASSPYALGCGGTSISATKGETAWSSGGGGPSAVYTAPTWQAGQTKRGVPDVAADADPNSGYPVVLKGQWNTFGGTSAVGPMWAAAVACVVSITGKRVSNLSQWLYANASLLTDVVSGSNGAFQARPGYDYCTGLGLPSPAMFTQLTQVVPPPPVPVGLPASLDARDASGKLLKTYR